MTSRILALNLPANAAQEVAGNPIVSRWESVVANCFPGLEIDHRNLDRRFFPGLIFDFISDLSNNPKSSSVGARLVGVDIEDFKNSHPADKVLKQLIPRLLEFQKALANGSRLFLHSLQQGSSPPIKLGRQKQTDRPLDGLVVWRLVRSLTPGMVTLILVERGQAGRERVYEKITARRRTYQNKQGALLTAYKPGELNQSLCSPWQHDFRDCSCNYWASNHPDIVLGAHPANLSELLKDPKEADQADRRFIWLRWDQSGEVPPLPTRTACRPFEMDYYEINTRWQDLPIVLEGHELRGSYAATPIQAARPFENTKQLVNKLHELAGIEHALALEYLYARYSMRIDDSPVTPEQQHADYIAHELLLIATSEMMHLRWANQLLWELWHAGYTSEFALELRVATHVPRGRRIYRRVRMQRMDLAIDDFIAAEEPSGSIDGQYARVFATLRHGYPPQLAELASRIVADGISHFTRFRAIRAILRHYANPQEVKDSRRGRPYRVPQLVHDISPASVDHPELMLLKCYYQKLISHLSAAYRAGNADDRGEIATARKIMMDLDAEAIRLSRMGRGIPFEKIGYNVAGIKRNGSKRRNQR